MRCVNFFFYVNWEVRFLSECGKLFRMEISCCAYETIDGR